MGDSRVRVLVRCRPLLPRESTGEHVAFRIDHRQSVVGVCPSESSSEKAFKFDAVADQTASQDDVYALGDVSALVRSTLAGYNATIFAYGQTASGKTFTMEGFEYLPAGADGTRGRDCGAAQGGSTPMANLHTENARLGVIPRAIAELFDHVDRDASRTWRVRMSYFQIYREQIHDLLSTPIASSKAVGAGPGAGDARALAATAGRRPRLRVRWTKARDFYVENLSEVHVAGVEEAMDLFQTGVRQKVVAETHMNAASSRSHAVVQLQVDAVDDAGQAEQTGTLSLVDLAGSERQPRGVEKSARMHEAVEINKSLFALRKVITALTNTSGSAGSSLRATARGPAREAHRVGRVSEAHVPYRDSVLTRVLKHSLGGSARTLMVACISCADYAAAESLSTLAYAARARTITNRPSVNADPKVSEIRRLREEIADLVAEVERLRKMLAETGYAVPAGGLVLARGGNARDGVGAAVPPPLLQPRRVGTSMDVAADAPPPQGVSTTAAALASTPRAGAEGAVASSRRADLLGHRLIESVAALKAALATSARLREDLDAAVAERRRAEGAQAEVIAENADLRGRVAMLESVLMMETYPHAAPVTSGTASAGRDREAAVRRRAMQEIIMLRQENADLQDRLSTFADVPRISSGGGDSDAGPGEAYRRLPAAAVANGPRARPASAQGLPERRQPPTQPPLAATRRLSSTGSVAAESELLLSSSQLWWPAPKNDDNDSGGDDALVASLLSEQCDNSDGHQNLDHLALLLRRRADLSRHTQVVTLLARHDGQGGQGVQTQTVQQ